MPNYLIVIAGATATGKTALSIALAKKFKTGIISADSRQFYREMNIGTAKPTAEELSQVPHHFINNLSVQDNYSVGQYEKEVIKLLNDFRFSIFDFRFENEKSFLKKENENFFFENKNKKNFLKNESDFLKSEIRNPKSEIAAVLVGGTGLFIRAVCEGLDVFPDVPENIKLKIENEYQQFGLEFLQNKLAKLDPIYFQTVDKNNSTRLMRALSVIESTGKYFSKFLTGEKIPRNFIPIYICLEVPRKILYERINHRVDVMIENGLVEEVRNLLPFKNLQALQTVGYSELFDYFDKKISLDEAIDKIKQHTRNYAKRQITWFKKDPHWKYFSPDDFENIVTYICDFINEQ